MRSALAAVDPLALSVGSKPRGVDDPLGEDGGTVQQRSDRCLERLDVNIR